MKSASFIGSILVIVAATGCTINNPPPQNASNTSAPAAVPAPAPAPGPTAATPTPAPAPAPAPAPGDDHALMGPGVAVPRETPRP
jgi:hypothetical protein